MTIKTKKLLLPVSIMQSGVCKIMVSVLAMICLPASLVYAQDSASGTDNKAEIEEVIVIAPEYVSKGGRSATKSDLELIETPMSVTVISRDQIDLLNWTSLQDSVRYTAGVLGENFGPDERYDWLTLRGFNPVQYIDGLQAPVGSVSNVGTDLYGFESVEILKGPSSVLYGHTPPGGIVNMRSRRPENEFAGDIGVQYGSYDHIQANGDITGPITDKLSGRLTALYRDRDTQVDFVNSKRVYVAPSFTFELSPDTSITALAYYQNDDVDNFSSGFLPSQGTLLGNPLGEISTGLNVGEPGYNTYEREQYAVGYEFTHNFSDTLSLEQNFKYFYADSLFRSVFGGGLLDADFNGVPDDFRTLNRSIFPFFEVVKSINVDSRIAKSFSTGSMEHNLLVGFDYRNYKNNSEFAFAFFGAPTLDVFNPVYGQPFTEPAVLFPFADQDQDQYGAYVQDQISINRLVLTLSARHDWVDTLDSGLKRKDRELSYRFGGNYVFDNGIAPYVQYARSFEPVTGTDFNGNPFDPTTGKQFEIGIKYDGRNLDSDYDIFGSIAAYTLKQKNVLTPDPDPTHLFFNVQTGEVEVKGIEAEIVARYQEQLSVNASFTYTDSEVTESNGPDLGMRLDATPKFKASFLADYTFQRGSLAGFGASMGVRYNSPTFGDPANQFESKSVTLVDSSIHYDTKNWKLAVSANNLFDKVYVTRCGSASDCYFGLRRIVVASITRKF